MKHIMFCTDEFDWHKLTRDKKYEVINESQTRYTIINDIGKEKTISKDSSYFSFGKIKILRKKGNLELF